MNKFNSSVTVSLTFASGTTGYTASGYSGSDFVTVGATATDSATTVSLSADDAGGNTAGHQVYGCRMDPHDQSP